MNTYSYLTFVPRIGTIYPRRSNKGFSSIFYVGFRVRRKPPEEARRTYRPKLYTYNYKDEVNSPNIQSDNNDYFIQEFITLVLVDSFPLEFE